MKKINLLKSNLIMLCIIICGFLFVLYTDTKAYQDLMQKHIESIVTIAATDISKEMENTMTKPIMVSKTMANDIFLTNWLEGEAANYHDGDYLKSMYQYLQRYQREYDYNSIFLVSASTGNYYYQGGLNKVMSRNDPHDVWYYNFLNLNQEFDVQIDTDEANEGAITAFVNFRVEDRDGNLLGVIGVGQELDQIQDIIGQYEQKYDLKVSIINDGGAENSFEEKTAHFTSAEQLQEELALDTGLEFVRDSKQIVNWYNNGKSNCLITDYVSAMKWFLVIQKDTDPVLKVLRGKILENFVYVFLILLGCFAVTTTVFVQFNKSIVATENIDELTGLPNRKLLLALSKRNRKLPEYQSLFMLDLDNFKEINDQNGHLYGNVILTSLGGVLQSITDEKCFVCRWGGDEFAGLVKGTTEETKARILQVMEQFKIQMDGKNITISAGVASLSDNLSEESLKETMTRADRALYVSKENGRDRITIYEELKNENWFGCQNSK